MTGEEHANLDNVRELADWLVEGGDVGASEQLMKLLRDILRKSGGMRREIGARLGVMYVGRFLASWCAPVVRW